MAISGSTSYGSFAQLNECTFAYPDSASHGTMASWPDDRDRLDSYCPVFLESDFIADASAAFGRRLFPTDRLVARADPAVEVSSVPSASADG